MVKDNIVIKIGDKIVDYDSDTAIALTYRAFDFSNMDEFFINGTNNFSLPITGRNRQIFEFSDMTNSNPNMPYDKEISEIYVNGVLAMRGTIYLESIDDRYNCILTEDKEVFKKLSDLKFCAPRVGDEYEQSLCYELVSYWNSTVKNQIRTQYNPSGTQNWLDSVYKYLLQKGDTNSKGERAPLNDFCIPFTMNCFSQQIPYAKVDDNEIAIKDNPITTTDYDNYYGYGLQIARQIVTVDPDGNYTRRGKFDVSPLWASVDLIIDKLEEITGYEFVNLADIINGYTGTGNRLFVHLPGVEFSTNVQPTGGGQYSLTFDGTVSLVSIGENEDYHFENGSVTDLDDKSIISSSCLDFIKMIMREFNLVMNIDSPNKKLTFRKFRDIAASASKMLVKSSEDSKSFKIDGINQKQCISYEGNNVNRTCVIDCANKTIEPGSYDDALFTINRYMYAEESYPLSSYISFGRRKKVNLYAPDFTTGDVQKGFIMAIPTSAAYSKYDVTKVGITGSVFHFGDDNNGNVVYYADYGTESQFQILNQPFCGSYGQYDYMSKCITYPQVIDMNVKMDVNFLHNFDRINSVKIDGYTGRYYVQEISSYNPRIDDTIGVKLIKLPMEVLKWPSFTWRTPTYAEMNYIISQRPNASNLRGLGRVLVNGTYANGCFIMPDDFAAPEGITFTPTTANYTTNSYTLEQFRKLEDVGVMFFVNNGYRNGSTMYNLTTAGNYRFSGDGYLSIVVNNISIAGGGYRFGMCIRLVRQSQQGKFSTPTGNIDFAPANLQYHCTQHIWRFAPNQYDYIGAANANISDAYDGWIDLFGYGTSGVNYSPTLHTTNNADYASGNISGTSNDWGVNEIEYGYDE